MKSRVGRTIVQILAIVVCLIGLRVSHKLLTLHAGLSSAQPSLLDQACTTFATSSCEEVLKSPYSVYHLGKIEIPMAQLGSLFFIIALCWLVIVNRVTPNRAYLHVLMCMIACLGLGLCLLLAYKMYFVLPKWCPLCAITHLCTLLIVIGLLLLWPRQSVMTVAASSVQASAPAADSALFPPVSPRPLPWPTWRAVALLVIVVTLAMLAQGFYVVAMQWQSQTATAETWQKARPEIEGMYKKFQDIAQSGQSQATNTDAWRRASDAVGELYKKYEEVAQQLQTKAASADAWQNAYKQMEKMYNRYHSHWQHTLLAWDIAPYVVIKTDDVAVRGPADAPHIIVIFSDFQCPTCAKVEEFLRTRVQVLAQKHGGVRIVFKHWPIASKCNHYVQREGHTAACQAALAAEAARIVGGSESFWKMHDLLFAQQFAVKTADEKWFVDRAVEMGLDAGAFRQAMQSKEASDRIAADVEEGANLGKGVLKGEDLDSAKVNSTPSIFVDGRPLHGWQHVRTWQTILSSTPRPIPAATQPRPPVSQDETTPDDSPAAAESSGSTGLQP